MQIFSVNTNDFQRIKKLFPKLEIRSIRDVSDGLANDVFVVNEELVFRFPRGESLAGKRLANEVKVIELLRKRVAMPLPKFEFVAEDATVHRYIAGEPFGRSDFFNLAAAERTAVVEQLGLFVEQMHEVPLEAVGANEIALSGSERDREGWLELYADVRDRLFERMSPPERAAVAEHFAPVLTDDNFMNFEPCSMNGDLKPSHILFDHETKKIAGVIDFGNAGIGDGAVDYACLIYSYGESFLREICRNRPAIELLLDRARFCAGTIGWQLDLNAARELQKTENQ